MLLPPSSSDLFGENLRKRVFQQQLKVFSLLKKFVNGDISGLRQSSVHPPLPFSPPSSFLLPPLPPKHEHSKSSITKTSEGWKKIRRSEKEEKREEGRKEEKGRRDEEERRKQKEEGEKRRNWEERRREEVKMDEFFSRSYRKNRLRMKVRIV